MFDRARDDLRLTLRLLRETHARRRSIVFIFFLELLAAPLALMVPLPIMITVDTVLGDKPLPAVLSWAIPERISDNTTATLLLVVAIVVLIALLIQFRHMFARLLQAYTGEQLTLEFRARLLRHSQNLPLSYHDRTGTADAIYRIRSDAPAIQWVIVYGLAPIFTAIVTIMGMIAITAAIDPQLAIVALAITPILIVLIWIFQSRLKKQWLDFKELETSALSVVQEVLSALRIVKIFGQETRENKRFMTVSKNGVLAQFHVVISESAFELLVGLTIALGTAMVLYLGTTHVIDDELSIGELLLIMSYLSQLYLPLEIIGKQLTKLQGGLASAERAFSLLDQAPDVVEISGAKALDRAKGSIGMVNVIFSYSKGQNVLDGMSLEIPSGSRVGIVGRSGSGKSTLVNLLMRFYDPQSGIVMLDGSDIKEYKLLDLRNQFSVVPQDPVLLSTSISENVAYGRPDADIKEIMAATCSAGVNEFVESLPEGYDTQVGERGLSLSGGQRQRIAIARAFLKDAPILILDEPTSSVDVETEASIIRAMDKLMENRTTLMIAHRTGTLASCDFVLEISEGKCRVVDSPNL